MTPSKRSGSAVGVGLFLAASAVACGQELPSPALLDKLRLVALTTDTPDVLAGSNASIAAVWFDGSARAGRPVHFLWRLCREGSDLEPRTCIRNEPADELLHGTADVLADRVTIDASRLVRVRDADTSYIVFVAMCPDQAPAWNDAASQFDCPSERGVENARREGIMAFRRILVRSTEGNRVPTIERVAIAGTEVVGESPMVEVPRCTAAAGEACPTVPLRVVAGAGSDERIDAQNRESMLVSYFFTAGSIDRPRSVGTMDDPLGAAGSLTAAWSPPRVASMVEMFFVLRDGRGGDAVRRARVNVR